ncbi:YHYH domain-containing protein [Catenovulum sediminis]|uniref:YHYH domain-containing protein n=1 Tax=Catenovulum sediminis TaxID=1740262 RepID=A0ABV1RHE4_9ALTE
MIFTSQVLSHSGRTNSSGCHNQRSTGGYHCHGTPSRSNSIPSYTGANYPDKAISKLDNNTKTKDTPDSSLDPLVLKIQLLLNIMKYNAGTEDGLMGETTARAIRQYQSEVGLEINGKPSATLLDALKKSVIHCRYRCE